MQKRVKTLHALGTRINLTVFGECDNDPLEAAARLIQTEENRLTVNRQQSEIMAINHAAGKESVSVSSATYQLVRRAVAASQEDFGFNALIGPLVKLWKIGFAGANVPEQAAIDQRLSLSHYQDISLDDQTHQVMLAKEGMELDLGGIAKGFIADQIRTLWQAFGVEAGIIDLGGNLLTVGQSPNRSDGEWVIGVQDPGLSRHHDLGVTVLPACSAVTSGIYERFLIKDGVKYHHLMDPRTGRPLQTDLAGVTIFTHDSIQGELEAKRLFFNGHLTKDWLKDPDHLGAVFAYQDGHHVSFGMTLS
ncbi:FAD:protein FMN transferase [Lapidilactobacillus bayanensis]|uniref:FAD:protein FMN transferase n=1 Tax=Lapidilactobacillus bayanensis TaxID=2485998 RepID=UPI000F786839|nr:FAD:protein FMN transferase [Lapidilactobacillus bayanensis]